MCHLDNVCLIELFVFHVETQSRMKVIILIYQDEFKYTIILSIKQQFVDNN